MKKLLTWLLFLFALPAFAQTPSTTAQFTAGSNTCNQSAASATPNCLQLTTPYGTGAASITLSGTFSATVSFKVSADGGQTFQLLSMTPSAGGAAVTSATAAGIWNANVAGYTNIEAIVLNSAYSSGAVVATIQISPVASIPAQTAAPQIFSTAATGQSATVGPVTIATPVANTKYRFTYYISQVAQGTSCAVAGNVLVNLNYTDAATGNNYFFQVPVITSGGLAANLTLATGAPGAGNVGAGVFTFEASSASVVTYTAVYTKGTCTTGAPTFSIYPILELMNS